MTFDAEQIKEIRNVFKVEAINYIKATARVLIRLADEGTEDAIKELGQAYGAVHGLNGSASSVGFARVSFLAGKLEEALGVIIKEQRRLSYADVDLLLEGLDNIRRAVEALLEDDTTPDSLTQEDESIAGALDRFIHIKHLRSSIPAAIEAMDDTSSAKISFFEEISPSSSAPPRKSSLKSSREMDIPQEQLQYLVSVFQAEAAEHIKSLAEMLFNLEEGKIDTSQILVNAFRQAHSLKGSAGTIGFERVAAVTHALEDALSALQKKAKKISSEIVDILLDTLDVIRRAVKDSKIGDAELSAKESNAVSLCRRVAANLADVSDTIVPPSKKSSSPPPASLRAGTGRARHVPAPEAAMSGKSDVRRSLAAVAPALKVPSKEEFIRVSEESIDNLIGHVGELFEEHLHLMSVTSELSRIEDGSERVMHLLQKWMEAHPSLGGLDEEDEIASIFETVKVLRGQINFVSKRFMRDEREFSKLIQSSQDALQKIRLAPISTIFVMIRRQVREICRITNKRVELFLDGGEYAVDRKVLEAIEDPLIHLIRNAVDHGIEDADARHLAGKSERGRISVVARHVGDAVELVVADDGRGIDPENIRATVRQRKLMKESEIESLTKEQLFDFLFESGFSTSTDVSKISGRGVGLDVVKFTMDRLGGEVRTNGRPGKGTAFSLRLPLSMSTLRCLLVRSAGRVMAIPAANVEKVILQKSADIHQVGGGEVVVFNNRNIALTKLSSLLRLATFGRMNGGTRTIVLVTFGERCVAFEVDDIVEYAQLILRPLGYLLERASFVSGVSLLASGEIALVLNPSDLVRAAGQKASSRGQDESPESHRAATILVVDDSMAARTFEKTLLEAAGYTVLTAMDGYQALDIVGARKCDLVVTDIQMPNMDGLTLARNIKTRFSFLHIPVILVSSLGSDEDKASGLESGADAYIVKKDLTQKELLKTIEQLL